MNTRGDSGVRTASVGRIDRPVDATKRQSPRLRSMAEPEVTVVIPVYNTRRYLTRCLRSLVDQTIGLDRMEVIAVDDGSTDGSARVLDRFARQHPGAFTVIHQPNSGGPAGPCNRAL